MKVNLCFKAKKVAFRERNHAKVEKSTFLHSSVAKKPARFFRFLKKVFLEVMPNPSLKGHFARRPYFSTWKPFTFSLLSINVMVS